VRLRILLAILLGLLVAGCGGGGSGRLSHAEFVKRADTLCRESVAKLKLLQNPHSLPELVTYLKQARPIQEKFLADSRKLRPPPKDEADWKRAIAFDEKVLSYYDEMAAAAKRGDRANLRRVEASLRALPAKNPYQQRLGLQGC
jgi:hypothetical protein